MNFKVYWWLGAMRVGCPDSYRCTSKNEAETLCATLEANGYSARFEEIDSQGRAIVC
jgi:hypothetical protein